MTKQHPKLYKKYILTAKMLNQVGEGENKNLHLPSFRTLPIDKANKRSRAHIYKHPSPIPQITNKRVF